MTVATHRACSTVLFTRLDVSHNTLLLDLRDLWALEDVWLEGVADFKGLDVLLEGLGELLVDSGLDKDTRTGTAALAVVEASDRIQHIVPRNRRGYLQDTKGRPFDGLVNIGIIEDNIGTTQVSLSSNSTTFHEPLSTKLKSDLLQVRVGSSLHDAASDEGTTRKGDLFQ
jgi:hypothetical protein